MRLLIDSHSLIWFVDQDHLLSAPAYTAMSDPANSLLISAASIWEISIKVGSMKLKLSSAFRPWMNKALLDTGAIVVPITVDYAMPRLRFRIITATRSTAC